MLSPVLRLAENLDAPNPVEFGRIDDEGAEYLEMLPAPDEPGHHDAQRFQVVTVPVFRAQLGDRVPDGMGGGQVLEEVLVPGLRPEPEAEGRGSGVGQPVLWPRSNPRPSACRTSGTSGT